MLTQCVKLFGEREHCKFGGDTCIGLEDIARKREGVRNGPPSGARVKTFQSVERQINGQCFSSGKNRPD